MQSPHKRAFLLSRLLLLGPSRGDGLTFGLALAGAFQERLLHRYDVQYLIHYIIEGSQSRELAWIRVFVCSCCLGRIGVRTSAQPLKALKGKSHAPKLRLASVTIVLYSLE